MCNLKKVKQLISILLVLMFSICLTSCNGSTKSKSLSIVIDMGGMSYSKDIEKAVELFVTANSEIDVVTDIIVYNEVDENNGFPERNAKVEQIRAAMLSGKGPDVIVSFDQANSVESSFFNNSRTALITNPYKSIQAGVFHDLSDKLSKNNILEKSNSAFSDASSVNDKTYLIPLTYSLYGLVNNPSANSSKQITFETSIETIKDYPGLYYDYLSNTQIYFGKSILNFNNLEVSISDEEASAWAKELYMTAQSSDTSQSSDLLTCEIASYDDRRDVVFENTRFIPIMSANSKYLSKITGYAGIIANSSNKDIAFEFITHLFNSPELSSYGFCVSSDQNKKQLDELDFPNEYKQDLQAAQERINGGYYNNDGSFQLFVSCYPYFIQQAQLETSITEAMSKIQLILKE